MVVEHIKSASLYYNREHNILLREYYNYAVMLIRQWLYTHDKKINIIMGDYNFNFNNSYKTIKIDIQCEHTLVKVGGRSVRDIIFGNVEYNNNHYLIRIDNFDYYKNLDYVIEYSMPNICNVSSNKIFDDYVSKNIYISPIIYDSNNFDNTNKTEIITMFTDNSNLRRYNILRQLKELNIENKCVINKYSKEELRRVYDRTRVLINVHQTDEHHTFEELRVLPALVNGVIIVSEDCPLKEKIPYHNHIIWCSYEDIPKTVEEVNENYYKYHEKIFDSSLIDIFNKMRRANDKCFDALDKL